MYRKRDTNNGEDHVRLERKNINHLGTDKKKLEHNGMITF